MPKPHAVSESESPVATLVMSADFRFSGDLSAGAEALLRKSCGRLDFLFLIETLFGGGILFVSVWIRIRIINKNLSNDKRQIGAGRYWGQ